MRNTFGVPCHTPYQKQPELLSLFFIRVLKKGTFLKFLCVEKIYFQAIKEYEPLCFMHDE